MANDRINRILEGLYKHATTGTGGEKENAKVLFDKLCAEHNIDPSVFEQAEQISEYRFKCLRAYRDLFVQVANTVITDRAKELYTRQKDESRIVYCKCTPSEAIELSQKFNFYLQKYKSDLEAFNLAFYSTNHLFNRNRVKDKNEEPLSAEEKAKVRKAAQMAQGLEKHQYSKQIDKSKKQ